jgi:hypothetical protein
VKSLGHGSEEFRNVSKSLGHGNEEFSNLAKLIKIPWTWAQGIQQSCKIDQNPLDMGPKNSKHFSSSLDFKPLFNHDAQILFQTMIKPQYMGFKPKRSPSVSNFKA